MGERAPDIAETTGRADDDAADDQLTTLCMPCTREYQRVVREHCKGLWMLVPSYLAGLIAKDFKERGLEAPPDRVPARDGKRGRKGVTK